MTTTNTTITTTKKKKETNLYKKKNDTSFSFYFQNDRMYRYIALIVTTITLIVQLYGSIVLVGHTNHNNKDIGVTTGTTTSSKGSNTQIQQPSHVLLTNAHEQSVQRMVEIDNSTTNITHTHHRTSTGTGFGACLLVKGDNELLYEWIAYHYTVLPLQYLIIGTDIENDEDPKVVTERWKSVPDITIHIIQSTEFIHRHGNYTWYKEKLQLKTFGKQIKDDEQQQHSNNHNDNNSPNNEIKIKIEKNYHHHLLVYRQKGFITTCLEMLHQKQQQQQYQDVSNNKNYYDDEPEPTMVGDDPNLQFDWVILIDTDEFIVINRSKKRTTDKNPTDTHNPLVDSSILTNYTATSNNNNITIHNHNLGTNMTKYTTVLDTIQQYHESIITNDNNHRDLTTDLPYFNGSLFHSGCYTMPRLLVSSLVNRSCTNAIPVQQHVQPFLSKKRYEMIHTIHYFQHSKKNDFTYSKYGKVMIHLKSLFFSIPNNASITIVPIPKNIHRPFPKICRPGSIHFYDDDETKMDDDSNNTTGCTTQSIISTNLSNHQHQHYPRTMFYITHYIGSYEKYLQRNTTDIRRNEIEYKKRAFVDDDVHCHLEIHQWVFEFIYQRIVNVTYAYYLLGGDSRSSSSNNNNNKITTTLT